MPVSIQMTYSGLSEVTRAVLDLPGIFRSAKKSAMGSVGWLVMVELRNHVEYGGLADEPLHALTKAYWKKRASGGKWIRRRRAPHAPAEWLGKFARYRVSDTGSVVQIDFGKGKRNKNPGRLDPELSVIARRIDSGEQIPVTVKMRRKWAATLARVLAAGETPMVGVNFFPLRRSTTSIDIPRRSIFDPVFRKIKPRVSGFFEKKFWEAYNRRRGNKP